MFVLKQKEKSTHCLFLCRIIDMEKEIKNKNSNYKRIDNMITSAFLKLAKEKPYSQITITELCNEANVNRTTFYKHYRGTWEIKDKIAKELSDVAVRIMFDFKGKDFINDSIEIFKAVNRELESRLDYYRSIFEMEESNMFSESIVDSIKGSFVKNFVPIEVIENALPIQVAFRYFAGGIIATYRGWFAGKVHGSLDDVAIILSQFIERSVIMK